MGGYRRRPMRAALSTAETNRHRRKAGAGPSMNEGRRNTKAEKDLRRIQSQYDPQRDRFDPEK